jgi:hypothetical protein
LAASLANSTWEPRRWLQGRGDRTAGLVNPAAPLCPSGDGREPSLASRIQDRRAMPLYREIFKDRELLAALEQPDVPPPHGRGQRSDRIGEVMEEGVGREVAGVIDPCAMSRTRAPRFSRYDTRPLRKAVRPSQGSRATQWSGRYPCTTLQLPISVMPKCWFC